MKVARADGDVDFGFEELGDELGERVELGVGEETDEVSAIAGSDVVALEVPRDVAEGGGVAVDVQGAQRFAFFFGGELAEEELREVGGCCEVQIAVEWGGRGYSPSEEREAPLRRKSSLPIWMVKTWGC